MSIQRNGCRIVVSNLYKGMSSTDKELHVGVPFCQQCIKINGEFLVSGDAIGCDIIAKRLSKLL